MMIFGRETMARTGKVDFFSPMGWTSIRQVVQNSSTPGHDVTSFPEQFGWIEFTSQPEKPTAVSHIG